MAINVSKDRIKLSIGVINPCIVKILLLFFFLSCGGVRRNPAFRKTVTAKQFCLLYFMEKAFVREEMSVCVYLVLCFFPFV